MSSRVLRHIPKLGRSGATAVEFALTTVPFLFLMMLTMEVCYDLAIDAALNAGAHVAGRYGTTGQNGNSANARATSIQTLVIANSGGLLSPSNLQMTETSYPNFITASQSKGSTSGFGSASQVVTYTLTYSQPYLTPIAAAVMGSPTLTHTSTVVVLNEPY